MQSAYRFVEVALYSLLNFIPYFLLAMIPFRQQLRFSKITTCLFVGMIVVIQIGLGIISAFSSGLEELLSLLSTVICAVFYFIVVKAQYGKMFFTLLMLSNFSNCAVVCAKCLEGYVFGYDLALQDYRYSFSLCLLLLHLLTILPLAYYFQTYYRCVVGQKNIFASWNYLWLIPATFYLTWFHHLYNNRLSALELSLELGHAVFLFVINLGAFLVYHTVIRMIDSQNRIRALEEEKRQLDMQNLQYRNLQERINEARQIKHDLRHHLIVIDRYLHNGEYEELAAYLNSYKRSLPDDSRIVFSQHPAVNAMLLYFAQLSKNSDVDFDVAVADIPKEFSLDDNVMTVVLGNLLENALHAAQMLPIQERYIRIKAMAEHSSLFLYVENRYDGNIKKDKNGYYLSTKREGRGIGLASIRSIVDKHSGILEIEDANGIFAVSVFLNAPDVT